MTFMRHTGKLAIISLMCSLSVVGCAEFDEPVAPEDLAEILTIVPPAQVAQVWTDDRAHATVFKAFAELAEAHPGFAGLYLREGGAEVIIRATQSTEHDPLIYAVTDYLERDFPEIATAQPTFRIEPAMYDFTSLLSWYASVSQIARQVEELVFYAIQYSSNRLTIGILTDRGAPEVAKQLENAGVPAAAFDTELVQEYRPTTDLTDRRRPTLGGFLIIDSTEQPCALGFNAFYESAFMPQDLLLVTAGHCLGDLGVTQGVSVYQPSIAFFNFLGYEYDNPPPFSYADDPRCDYWACRWSDAATMIYSDPAHGTYGHIARTQYPGTHTGSTTLDPNAPSFEIGARPSYSLEGQSVEKIGPATGWTVGQISHTGVNVRPIGGGIWLLNQELATFNSGWTDSGAPVFSQIAFSDQIALRGIYHGVVLEPMEYNGYRVLSPLGGIERDLGWLRIAVNEAP
jgi:hypothetical protein